MADPTSFSPHSGSPSSWTAVSGTADTTQPKQNAEFWSEKIARNQARDLLVTRRLRARGWRVVRFWEHELTKRYEARLIGRLRRLGLLDFASGTERGSAEMVAPSPARPRKPRKRLQG